MLCCTNAQHRVRNNGYAFESEHYGYKNGHLPAQGLCRNEEEDARHKEEEEPEIQSWKIKRRKHHRYVASVAERTGKSTLMTTDLLFRSTLTM